MSSDAKFGWCMVVILGGFALFMTLVVAPIKDKERQAIQQQRETFYREHNCRPEGYVATKYDPVRTYRCDNGLFIWRDMR